LKTLQQTSVDSERQQQTLNELHKSFASLSQEEQKYAKIFLNDIQRGDVNLEPGKTFRDYITDYQSNAKNSQIIALAQALGLDQSKIETLMKAAVTTANLNEFGRFNDLKNTVDKAKAKAYFEQRDGVTIPTFKVNIKVDQLLQDFILRGGFDLQQSEITE
jgi:type I restriction enzyme R subunit